MTYAPLVGLVGRKRSGKDSVASVLVERFGFQRFAFADSLKRAALESNPILSTTICGAEIRLADHVAAVGWEKAKDNPEVRRYLQRYGMAIRDIDPNFWLRQALSAAEDARREGVPAVITDVRFANEADQVEREGGVLVRVIRPGLDETDEHVSETELATRYTPYAIVNSGTLADLRANVVELHGTLIV